MAATKVAKKRMDMPKIKIKAKKLGITPGRMKKAELIHSIQIAEGFEPCFGRSGGECFETTCCFMPECLKISL